MTRKLPFFLLLLASPSAQAWGPFTHYAMGLDFVRAHRPDCAASPACTQSFADGSVAPDWIAPQFHTYGYGHTHDLFFAAYMRGYVQEHGARYATAEFDPMAFALGYGFHVACDITGHHPNEPAPGGYIDDTLQFPQEYAVDRYAQREFVHGSELRKNPLVGPAARRLIWDVLVSYREAYGDRVLQEMSERKFNLFTVLFNSGLATEGASIRAITRSDSSYRKLVLAFDRFKPADWMQAHFHLKEAFFDSAAMGRLWIELVESGEPAATARDRVLSSIDRQVNGSTEDHLQP